MSFPFEGLEFYSGDGMVMFDGDRLLFVSASVSVQQLLSAVRSCFEKSSWQGVLDELHAVIGQENFIGHKVAAFERQETHISVFVSGGMEIEVLEAESTTFTRFLVADGETRLSQRAASIAVGRDGDTEMAVGHLLHGVAPAGGFLWRLINHAQDGAPVGVEDPTVSIPTAEADTVAAVAQPEVDDTAIPMPAVAPDTLIPPSEENVILVSEEPEPQHPVQPDDEPQAASSEQEPAVDQGPTIRGVLCSDGHLNSLRDAQCRFCSREIDQSQDFITGPRPPLGVLYFADGSVALDLSAPVVAGSSPPANHVVNNEIAQPLHLEGHESIASSHCEIVLKQWTVSVTDLGSETGTYLLPDGESGTRLRLRNGVPQPLTSGSVIDVGGCLLRYETWYH